MAVRKCGDSGQMKIPKLHVSTGVCEHTSPVWLIFEYFFLIRFIKRIYSGRINDIISCHVMSIYMIYNALFNPDTRLARNFANPSKKEPPLPNLIRLRVFLFRLCGMKFSIPDYLNHTMFLKNYFPL